MRRPNKGLLHSLCSKGGGRELKQQQIGANKRASAKEKVKFHGTLNPGVAAQKEKQYPLGNRTAYSLEEGMFQGRAES